MKILDISLSLLIPGLILLHLIVAPYTKVEESFNIQATHDILIYGTPLSDINRKLASSYDHFTFPGAVPRTFIGSVLLAGISQPFVALAGFQHAQFIARAILGLFNAASLLFFAQNVRRTYGAPAARWYLLLQATQFHVIFYASRTLPNMFAFGLTTLAFSFLIPSPDPKQALRRTRLAIALFVFAAAVFRSEVALLLGTTVLHLLVIPATSLQRVIPPFVVSFLIALTISVPVDSYFWQRPLWPELWGFYYNAIQGSSSNWGVSPWHYYFVSALPRLLLNPLALLVLLPLSLWHPALRPAAGRLVVPSLLFVAIYSLQPHKEARFIFYVVPPLTAACALAANLVFNRAFGGGSSTAKKKNTTGSIWSILLALALAASIVLSFAVSTGMLLISSLNYPGGEALSFLRTTVLHSSSPPSISSQPQPASSQSPPSPPIPAPATLVPVHADVLACMTGVTLFGTATGSHLPNHHPSRRGGFLTSTSSSIVAQDDQTKGGSTISSGDAAVTLALDKTEDLSVLAQPGFWTRFDYVLTQDPAKVLRSGSGSGSGGCGGEWDVVAVVKGYAGVEVITGGGGGRQEDGEEKEKDEEEEKGAEGVVVVVGRGAIVEQWKRRVMSLTGGSWWVGPRMVPKIYILKRVKEGKKRAIKAVEA